MRRNSDVLPDLTGRAAVVTGGNSGIGFHTALELARHGADVVLACRDARRAQQAAERIGHGVTTAEIDLASMTSVQKFAADWDRPLHLLVNNAGVMAPPKQARTADGFELQFGTNHLAHFVLTGLLLPHLADAGSARVVTVSSIAHHGGTNAVLDANAGPYDARLAYAQSKLANLLFATQLQRELDTRGLAVTSTAAHPGLSATGLTADREGLGASPAVRMLVPPALKLLTQSAAAGAHATLFAAFAAEPGSYSGPTWLRETRGPVGPARLSSCARDQKLAQRLWHVSEELTGLRYDWHPLS